MIHFRFFFGCCFYFACNRLKKVTHIRHYLLNFLTKFESDDNKIWENNRILVKWTLVSCKNWIKIVFYMILLLIFMVNICRNYVTYTRKDDVQQQRWLIDDKKIHHNNNNFCFQHRRGTSVVQFHTISSFHSKLVLC